MRGPNDAFAMAVHCRNVQKHYGSGKKKVDVLCGLDMSVPYGAIYGLLGSSGCGKTTLLKCIVGRMKVNNGKVLTLGKKPGSAGHLVPGKMVGYMPQEIALFMRFTIEETLTFFGRLHGMESKDIKYRTDFLLGFLTLPTKNRLVSQLSGGQQRRVSLAAALLQEPELLILDEPTVGVDPVLREKIWEHLLEIAKSSLKTTIIVTTHYIEEAALADKVGLMRGGRLLAEDKPSVLMSKYRLQNLEAVFLHLCHQDRLPNVDDEELLPSMSAELESSRDMAGTMDHVHYQRIPEQKESAEDSVHLVGREDTTTGYGTLLYSGNPSPPSEKKRFSLKKFLPSLRNLYALCIKNLTSMKRNIPILLFEFMIPIVQIVLFCVCIGREPQNISVSITNEDVDDLGDLFVRSLNNNTLTKHMRDDLETALEDVRNGDSWCAIHLKENFSLDLMTRFENGLQATNETILGSTIMLYPDMTNQEIAITIQQRVLEAFTKFSETLLSSFGFNPSLGKLPIGVGNIIYGSMESSFTDFMASGLIVSATFFLATGLTTLSFVLERKEGLLERTYVAGVSALEIMVSHVVTQLLIMFGQVMLMLSIALLVFHVPNHGNILILITLVILQGLCGMTLGMVISSCCKTENASIQATLGTMYPALLTSGIIWPVEAMPVWMMKISLYLPMTYPTYAVRSVMGRGWGLDHTLVWSSYFITMAWIFVHSLLASIVLHFSSE